MKKVAAVFMLVACSVKAQEFNIIPYPKQIEVHTRHVERERAPQRYTRQDVSLPDEGYRIRVTKDSIIVSYKDHRGRVWAEQTLAQLPDAKKLPVLEIADYPAFAMRGFMLDTGRNFVELASLKEYLTFLSRYKINIFHWHLADNPAWRIESKIYPQLNDARYQRKGRDEGRFYTYDQIRELFHYADSLGIMIIPEIDMPGHSAYFTDTFGFTMDSPQGMAVLEKCLDEFFTEIPRSISPYFHIGSDEIHIKDPEGFMAWVQAFVAKYHRRMLAWDPGLPAHTTTIRQIWNEASGMNSAAVDKGGTYLDSFVGYLNYYDPILFINRLYLHTPCFKEKGGSTALGGILCLWNDVNVDDKEKIPHHSGYYAGVMTFAERFWAGGRIEADSVDVNLYPDPKSDAGKKLQAFEKQLVAQSPADWYPNASTEWEIRVGGKSGTFWGGAIDMSAVCTRLGVAEKDTMQAVALTKIFARRDTTLHIWVGFDAPARSNRIGVGVGRQGEWEAGGKLIVNGKNVQPPVWNEPGKYAFDFNTWHRPEEELPYTDEQFYWRRNPTAVKLKKGWNEVKIVAPKVFKGQRWSFAFIQVSK